MFNFPRVSRSLCAQEPNDSYLRAKMRGLGILGMSFALIVRCSVRLSIGLSSHTKSIIAYRNGRGILAFTRHSSA